MMTMDWNGSLIQTPFFTVYTGTTSIYFCFDGAPRENFIGVFRVAPHLPFEQRSGIHLETFSVWDYPQTSHAESHSDLVYKVSQARNEQYRQMCRHRGMIMLRNSTSKWEPLRVCRRRTGEGQGSSRPSYPY